MKRHRIGIVLLLLLAVAALATQALLPEGFFSVSQVKAHKEQLLHLVQSHYLEAVCCFIGIYLATALFLPGALALTVAGGLMFGTLPAMLYVNIGASAGAVLAFFACRFFVGEWAQRRYRQQLDRFNKELERHGHNYLLILRILPIVPFFAVNYGAGLTRIPLRTFLWTTSLGVIPGSLIYAFIGEELGRVNELRDVFSWQMVLALGVVVLLALAPCFGITFSTARNSDPYPRGPAGPTGQARTLMGRMTVVRPSHCRRRWMAKAVSLCRMRW